MPVSLSRLTSNIRFFSYHQRGSGSFLVYFFAKIKVKIINGVIPPKIGISPPFFGGLTAFSKDDKYMKINSQC
jgi:hypothetical protein